MKLHKITKIILVAFILNAALFAIPDQGREPQKVKPDSTDLHKENTHIPDSASVLADTAWLSTVKGKAKARLSTWDNQDITVQSVEMTVEQLTPQLLLEEMTRNIMTSNPEDIAGYDFRNNTSYRMDAAEEYVTPEHHKRNDIMWVGGQEAVMAASEALKKTSDGPEITLSGSEIGILKTLWKNHDISAKEWYKAHYENSSTRPMSYLAFIQEINRLKSKELINIETKEDVQYFSPTISRSLLVWLARQELISSDAIFNTARHFELLKMQESLENHGEELQQDTLFSP